MPETMYRLSAHDSPQPDVSMLQVARPQPDHTGLIPICPELAVEVVSSESARHLQIKIQLYLRHGAKVVWVAYPELRVIDVYTGSGVRRLTEGQMLEAGDVLPGFSVPVSAFFEGL